MAAVPLHTKTSIWSPLPTCRAPSLLRPSSEGGSRAESPSESAEGACAGCAAIESSDTASEPSGGGGGTAGASVCETRHGTSGRAAALHWLDDDKQLGESCNPNARSPRLLPRLRADGVWSRSDVDRSLSGRPPPTPTAVRRSLATRIGCAPVVSESAMRVRVHYALRAWCEHGRNGSMAAMHKSMRCVRDDTEIDARTGEASRGIAVREIEVASAQWRRVAVRHSGRAASIATAPESLHSARAAAVCAMTEAPGPSSRCCKTAG